MGFTKTQGTCTGRGFADVDADGYLKNLHDYVTGHVDWSIILDRSTLPTQQTCTNANGATEEITCTGHGYYNSEIVRFVDVGNGLPSGISAATDYFITVVDANTFKISTHRQNVHAANFVNIGALAANFGVIRMEPYILISNNSTPANANVLTNMIKFGYHTQESAYIRAQMVASFDSSENEIVFLWDGMKLPTLDAAAFVYNFRANDTGLFYVQTYVSGTWRGAGVDEGTPLSNYLESPTTISGTVQTSLTNGSNVVCQMTNATEANLFTNGEWYYVFDMRWDGSIPRIAVAYGECNGVGVADGLNADEIRFATLNNDFNSGAKVSPYPLTVYSIGNSYTTGNVGENDFRESGYITQIPFYGRSDGTIGHYCINDQAGDIQGGLGISREQQAIITAAPDDKGNYTVQRPLICENKRPNSYTTTQMNRPYFEAKNIYSMDDDGQVIMSTGRNIESKEHITIGNEGVMFAAGGNGALVIVMINEA